MDATHQLLGRRRSERRPVSSRICGLDRAGIDMMSSVPLVEQSDLRSVRALPRPRPLPFLAKTVPLLAVLSLPFSAFRCVPAMPVARF